MLEKKSLNSRPILRAIRSFVSASYPLLFCGLLVQALLLNACSGQPAQPKATPIEAKATPAADSGGRGSGDTLRILNPQAPDIINPHLTSYAKNFEVSRIVYEPLASFDKDGVLIPFLAAEIPTLENGGVAADGKSVTWKLRQDVFWSDGTPFTADDVLFTYEYIIDEGVNATSKATYRDVESVQVIDDYTVKVNFEDVNPVWAAPFVGVKGMILPRHIFEPHKGPNALKAPANTMPVGTGPYRVLPPGIKPQEILFLGTQLVETNKIVFEPNPYFREADKPFFSRVEFRGGGTAGEAARLAMQDGEVDFAYDLGRLSPEEMEVLQVSSQGRLVVSFGAKVDRVLLNRTDPNRMTEDGERSSLQFPHPFFSDKKVRQAFAHAINRDAIAAFYGPTGRPTTNSLVAPPQYSSPNVFYEFDLSKSNALLDEAGWVDSDNDGVREKGGVELKVSFQTPTTHQPQIRQVIKEALESIGVKVELKITDSGTMFDPCSAANPDADTCFNADLQEFSIRSRNPDPGAYMHYWTCDQIPQKDNNWTGWNDERWCNQEYVALYEQSTAELNPETRRQLFIQMNDMLIEDVVMIPVVYLAEAHGVNQNIEGLDLTPWDAGTWNIKDWRRISP